MAKHIAQSTSSTIVELQDIIYQSNNYTRKRLHQTRLNWVQQAIKNYTKKTSVSRAIEYGPGSGIYLPILSENFNSVIAADIERAHLESIQNNKHINNNVSLVFDDLLNSKLQKDSFGLALCTEVLEHINNPEEGLKTIFNLLSPGGVAIITTPQRFSSIEVFAKIAFLPGVIKLTRKIYNEPIVEMGHISLRTASQFKRHIDECGFEILDEKKFGLHIPLLAEFGGKAGGQLIAKIENILNGTIFEFLFGLKLMCLLSH